jgi:SAM-dependent methyltransferase
LNPYDRIRRALIVSCALALGACASLQPTEPKSAPAPAESADAFEPRVGQEGKDVIWVPTPEILVERMLDLAKVTPRDFVIDLGSGDGRNVIAAAKRGARALGVEYNPKMVEYSRRAAAKAGVTGKATFVHGDMFEADISQATVLALFLLTTNLDKLAPKFLEMKPGTRIVSNGFQITCWEADVTSTVEGDCGAWCTAYLYIVPAKAAGTWQLPKGELVLEQNAQTVTGSVTVDGKQSKIEKGRLSGERITFNANGVQYAGRVTGETMQLTPQGAAAVRAKRVNR